jgi:uncharacterized protein (TIGR03067 family)
MHTLILTLAGFFPCADPAAVLLELGKLEGTWRLAGIDENGKSFKAGDTVLVIKNGRFTATSDGKEEVSGIVDLDPAKKTLDFLNADRKPLILSLYRLDGDRLELCVGGDDRPKEWKGSVATYSRRAAK